MLKINLLINNPDDVRNGYVNFDPFAEETDNFRVKGNVLNLDHSVDNGEADEIVSRNIIEYVGGKEADSCLENWLSKLKIGGILHLITIDAIEVSRAIVNRVLSPEQYNIMLYGEQKENWDYKKCSFDIKTICDYFENKSNYKIMSKRIENYEAIVSIKRIS